MYSKILILDNDVIYPICSYKVISYHDVGDKNNMLYFQHELNIVVDTIKVNMDLLRDLNILNYGETTIVLFNEDNIKCLVLSKTYLKHINNKSNTAILDFDVVRMNETDVYQIESLKYIARDLKIKSILDS
jgi:hypothetical protein